MSENGEIKIEIPNNIVKKIRNSGNISETLKIQLQEKARSLVLQQQNRTKSKFRKTIKDVDEKVEMIFEIALDRLERDSYISKKEILQIMDGDKKYLSPFLIVLKKFARVKGYNVQKCARNKKTCYRLTY